MAKRRFTKKPDAPESGTVQLPFGLGKLSGWRQELLFSILPALATVAVYAAVVRNPFVNYDDGAYVVKNEHVTSGLNLETVRWALTSLENGNWHPLTWLSHALDYQFFGLHAGGHHAVSLLLHVFNVVMVYVLLARTTKRSGSSLVVAALFALHPLNVESVAWVAERKNVLCTSFCLLALAAYGWYARKAGPKRYLLVVGIFLLALASKPMAVSLPFLLLLLDFWPLRRIESWSVPSARSALPQRKLSDLLLEKVPLLLISIASSALTWVAQSRSSAIAADPGSSAFGRLLDVGYGYFAYLWKALIPLQLSAFYPRSPIATGLAVIAMIAIVVITWLAWRAKETSPYLLTGWLWFLITLAPVIGIVPIGGQAMADRYAYIPLLGIFTAVVWACADIKFVAISWRLGFATALLAVFSVLSWKEVHYWNSDVALWGRALEVTQNNFVAEENLGVALLELGRDDEARPRLTNAVRIAPADPTARLNLGTDLVRHELSPETAIEHLEAVTHLTQDPSVLTAAFRGLGVAYAQVGDREKARENFRNAARLSPGSQNELFNLAVLEIQDAATRMNREVTAHPTPQGYLQLGQMLQQGNMIADARTAYQDALRLDPQMAEAKRALEELKQ